jgi:hypothetical protein
VDRTDLDLAITFEYGAGGAWSPVPGAQHARVRVYTVLGPVNVAPSGVTSGPYLPWLAAVDQVCGWAGGAAHDEAGVSTLVADGVYTQLGLAYDTTAGAPAYAFGTLDDLELDLSGFFDRARGSYVNCSDCATLVATFTNMVGGNVDYAVLGWNFTLNYIKPIGVSTFTNDPFGVGPPGMFAFHAAATRDGGLTVHDACLSIDDDAHPASRPNVEGRPRGMGFVHYSTHLSPDPVSVSTVKHPRLR